MPDSPTTALSGWQKRIVVVAWITYATYYLGRVNISTAMPEMQAELGFTAGQIGLLSTGFFWSYAIGQLINGRLGDRLSPRRFVAAGLAADHYSPTGQNRGRSEFCNGSGSACDSVC